MLFFPEIKKPQRAACTGETLGGWLDHPQRSEEPEWKITDNPPVSSWRAGRYTIYRYLLIFIADVPIETPISSGFPIATFDSRRVSMGFFWWDKPRKVQDDFRSTNWKPHSFFGGDNLTSIYLRCWAFKQKLMLWMDGSWYAYIPSGKPTQL